MSRSTTGGSATAAASGRRTLGAAGAAASGVGGAFLAAASAACCTGPGMATLVVTVLGAGGAAWAAGLKPYSPYLSAASLLFIGVGFWSTRRRPSCAAEPARARLWSRRLARTMLWLASAVWAVSVAIQWTGGF